MKKVILFLVALTLTGQSIPQSMTTQQEMALVQQQQAQAQQQMQQFYKSFKYQYTFTNNFYYPMTVKLKFADGTTQSNTVQAADYPNGNTHPMNFLSNSCLTDVWVSGKIPVGGSGAGVSGGSSQTVSTDHHGMNVCSSKGFAIDPISSDPYVQLNW